MIFAKNYMQIALYQKASVHLMPYCPNCGKQVEEGTQFCPFCGKPLSNAPQKSMSFSPSQPMPTPSPPYQKHKTSHTGRNLAIGLILAIIVIVIVVAMAVPGSVPGISKPSQVVLSGTVTTTGTGTSPEKITFTSETTGNNYVADANGGTYSVTLPNQDTYSVSITWKFLGITGGTADAGTLNLDSASATMTENWSG